MAKQQYIRTEYSDGSVVLSNVRAKNTNETYSLEKVTTLADGTILDDTIASALSPIYRKLGNEYFRKIYGQTVSPRDFGAVGDGVTDDSDAVEKCLRSGIKVASDQQYRYLIKRQLTVSNTDTDTDGLNLLLDSASLMGRSALVITNPTIKSGVVNNSATINELSDSIILDNSEGVQKGDIINIRAYSQSDGAIIVGRRYVITSSGGNFTSVGAPNNSIGTDFIATAPAPDYGTGGGLLILWGSDPRPGVTNVTLGETHKVRGVNGNTVLLDTFIMDQYSSTLNLRYTVYRPKKCLLNNVKVTGDVPEDYGFLSITGTSPTISNCTLNKVSGRVGISFTNCYNALVTSSSILNGYYEGSTTGYGIQDNGSTGTTITGGCFLNNNRRSVDFSGTTPSKKGGVSFCTITANRQPVGSCIGTHGGADLLIFESNRIEGGIIGIQLRCSRVTIKNNEFIGQTTTCVYSSFGDTITIEGNKVISSKVYATNNIPYFVQTDSSNTFDKSKPLVIRSNTIDEIKVAVLTISGGTEAITMRGLKMMDNIISFRTSSAGNGVHLIANMNTQGGVTTLADSYINNNPINRINGVYSPTRNIIMSVDRMGGDLVYKPGASDVVKWGGSGQLENIVCEINQIATLDGQAIIQGYVSFNVVSGPVTVRINNVFKYTTAQVFDTYTKDGNMLRVDQTGALYIGYEVGDSPNVSFPIGTGYRIIIDIKYPIRNGYAY